MGNTSIRETKIMCESKDIKSKKDENKLIELYGFNCYHDDAVVLNRIAVRYMRGFGVEKDMKEAVRLFKLSAEKGYSQGQYNLARCYSEGDGIEKDEKEALRLYKLSSDQGNPSAQNNLAHLYICDIKKDLEEAIRLLKLSAGQGNAVALHNLAFCYENGFGIEKDLKEALTLYTMSLKSGCDDAIIKIMELS